MKLLFKLIIAMIAGIVISYATLIDSIIKQLIEQEGSKALHAKVELSDVEFHIFSSRLILRDFAATNPQEPLRNIITASEINGTLNLGALLSNKIIIDTLTANNLRFQQLRKTSGAIEGLTPDNNTAGNNTLLPVTNTQQVIDQLKQQAQVNLDTFSKQAVDIKTQWQQRRETFVASQQLNRFKDRWNDLQTASTAEKLSGFRSLKKDITGEYTRVAKIAEDLQIDLAVTQEIQQQANQVISTQTEANNVSLNEPSGNMLSNMLLADSLQTLTKQLIASYQQSIADKHSIAWPLLIKQVGFNGQLDLGANPLPVEGVINNINTPSSQWQLPVTLKITTTPSQQRGSLMISGTFDHRNATQANDRIDINLVDIPVSALSLSRRNDVRVMLGQAIASISGTITTQHNQLALQINNQFKQAQLTIETNVSGSSNGSTADNSLSATLAESLRNIDRFDVQMNASGALDKSDIAIDVTSSLDALLASAAKQFIKTTQEQLRPEIEAALKDRLEISLNGLTDTRTELESFNNDISRYQQALKNLMSTF